MPKVSATFAKRLALCFALLIPIGPWLSGCTGAKTPVTIFNPDKRRPLFARSNPKIVIGVTDPREGVFDTADWAFIKHRAPWDPMARDLSVFTDTRIRFHLLTPFQIAHLFQLRRCDFALVSGDEYGELIREGASARIIAHSEPFRRQGILMADAKSDIRTLEDLRGRAFAFGPRTDPVLFFKTLAVLDKAGISPSDLKQELVLTGFDGALQHHRNSRQTAREIVYGLRAQAGVVEAAVYEGYPETGGRWFPLVYTFSKDQFIVLDRTDPVEAVTLHDAVFVAADHVDDALVRRVQEFLVSAHVQAPEAIHALGFGRFSMPPMPQDPSHDSTEETTTSEPATVERHVVSRDDPTREIARFIQDLSHASFDVRSVATRKLCTYPLVARIPLQRAARGDAAERALRARAVLSLLDQIAFSGVDIKLGFSSNVIAWDQSADLVLTLHNRSNHPATIPFILSKALRDSLQPSARQVGDMLDLSEWLTLRGEDGAAIEFHLDDILDDAAVAGTVHGRIAFDPKSKLGPGETVSLTIEAFNRGGARYALLKKGRYTATLEYLPPWQDEAFIRDAVGSAQSNTATISVSKSAPPGVTSSGSPATLDLILRGQTLTAVLTNRNDLPWIVNTNFDAPAPSSAHGIWALYVGEESIVIPATPPWDAQDASSFDPGKLVQLQPGATLDLFSIDVPRLRDHVNAAGGSDSAAWSVLATYDNIRRQARFYRSQAAAKDGDQPGPVEPPKKLRKRILYTHLASPEIKSIDLLPGNPNHDRKGVND